MSSSVVEYKIRDYTLLLDSEDIAKVDAYTWRPNVIKNQPWLVYFRAYTEGCHARRKEILLHRLVMGCSYKDGTIVDHIDGNTLNNSKSNLRFCSPSENAQNARKSKNKSSKYKGVTWDTRVGKWKGTITYQGKQIHFGYFDDIEKAKEAYNQNAIELFGQYAYTNDED